MASESVTVEVSGRELTVSSPDKVFFKTRGETKLDLIHYYQAVEGSILDTMAGRPTLMQRFPDGAHGKSFFQKRIPASAPEWLQTTEVSTPQRDHFKHARGSRPGSPGVGRQPRVASAFTPGPTTPPPPASPTSYASTSTPRPASPSIRCARPPTRLMPFSTSSVSPPT